MRFMLRTLNPRPHDRNGAGNGLALWLATILGLARRGSGSPAPLLLPRSGGAAFTSTLSVFGLGQRRGIEVYDRRGQRVGRFVAAGAYVRSAGERLVISTCQRELTPPRGAVPG
jgi:hypothetical protein